MWDSWCGAKPRSRPDPTYRRAVLLRFRKAYAPLPRIDTPDPRGKNLETWGLDAGPSWFVKGRTSRRQREVPAFPDAGFIPARILTAWIGRTACVAEVYARGFKSRSSRDVVILLAPPSTWPPNAVFLAKELPPHVRRIRMAAYEQSRGARPYSWRTTTSRFGLKALCMYVYVYVCIYYILHNITIWHICVYIYIYIHKQRDACHHGVYFPVQGGRRTA